MTTITVAGEAEIKRPAELGTVHITVSTDGPDRQSVVDEATRIHTETMAGIAELWASEDSAVQSWVSSGVTVSSTRPWNQDGQLLPFVHTAVAPISVIFTDPGRLSDWVGSVATEDGVVVDGVEWTLTDATRDEVTADVRVQAVKAAVRAAATYAAALALTDLKPVAIADPGLLDPSPSQPGLGASPMAASLRMTEAAPGLHLTPDLITMAATVHVRFETA